MRAFQALFNNTQLDVAVPLMKGWTFCEPLLQHMLGSLNTCSTRHIVTCFDQPLSLSNGSASSLGSPVISSLRGTSGLPRRTSSIHTYAYLRISFSHIVCIQAFSSNVFTSPVGSSSNKGFIHELESWKNLFSACILHQEGGCVNGTITDAQNLLTYIRWRGGKGLIHGRKAQ